MLMIDLRYIASKAGSNLKDFNKQPRSLYTLDGFTTSIYSKLRAIGYAIIHRRSFIKNIYFAVPETIADLRLRLPVYKCNKCDNVR